MIRKDEEDGKGSQTFTPSYVNANAAQMCNFPDIYTFHIRCCGHWLLLAAAAVAAACCYCHCSVVDVALLLGQIRRKCHIDRRNKTPQLNNRIDVCCPLMLNFISSCSALSADKSYFCIRSHLYNIIDMQSVIIP